MNRIAWRALKVGLPLTAGAVLALVLSSGGHAIVLDVYLLCIGGVLLLALVRVTRVQAPAERDSAFTRALAAMRIPALETAEPVLVRELELSTYNAFHFHTRLRPLFRDIAAHRLRTHYGVDLEAETGRARDLVGAAAWDVVRPDRPPPEDRMASGPTPADLRRLVDELEAI